MSSEIRKKMNQVATKLEQMQGNYDSQGFANQLDNWVGELRFFYNTLVSKQPEKNAGKTFYNIRPGKRPKEGQIAYFNLRRGYPKEVFDGHYCYVLKDFGTKFIIIPTTSVKDGSVANPRFEYDIEIENFKNQAQTRLQVTDIRSIDVQRINELKGIYDVKTDRETILKEIRKITDI